MSTITGSPEAASKPSAKSIYEQRKRYSTMVMADVSQYLVNIRVSWQNSVPLESANLSSGPALELDSAATGTNQMQSWHLVTFCLGEEDGVHTVEDASRKLSVMDSQGRVWAQEMLLRISSNHLTLLDSVSKEELQSYPLGAIVRCDVVMPPGRSRSLLLLLVCQEPERLQPDVHFFQSLSLGAELIHEDIQGALHSYRSGRGDRQAAALKATQEELLRRTSPTPETPPLQRHPSVRATICLTESATGCGGPQTEPIPEVDAAPRLGGAETSRSTDTASPDLSPHGPDLVTLQAEREVDILNHVFDDVENFVSKLQKSAEAARVLEHRERGRRAPRRETGEDLLTQRAKPPSEAEYTDVLQKIKYAFSLLARLRGNIANPSSPELLHFLFGPLHVIVEMSGGPQLASGVRRPHLTSDAVALLRENVTPSENVLWTSLGDSWTRPGLELPLEEGPTYIPKFCSGWEPPTTDLQGRPWEDPVEKQLQHERRRRQQSAPQIAVNGHQDPEPEAEPQLEPEAAGKWVLCNYDFQARNSSELSIKHQDVLEVLDDKRKWWKVRDQRGQEGYVPYNILSPHPRPQGGHSQSSARILNSAPPPPPAPAPAVDPAPARPHWDSCDSLNNLDPSEKEKFCQMVSVNEELQARLAQGRSGPSRTTPGPRTPETQLSTRSNASEVRAWLQARGFSSRTVEALGVLTGAQIFSLQKVEFKVVSPEEGARVYSQVMVQRALLEDKEKVSELEEVMEKQKKKVEGEIQTEVI